MRRAGMRLTPTAAGACLAVLLPLTACGRQAAPPPALPSQAATQSAPVSPATEEVRRSPLPDGQRRADLNTATFDSRGRLWFTGQNGIYGRLDPASGKVDVFDAPKGRGPYGMTTTRDGGVFFASLAGSY